MIFSKVLVALLMSLPVVGLQPKFANESANSLDLEFNTSTSINGFTSSDGNISYVHNSAMLVEGGQNLNITSPTLSSESGNKYSALLPSRNTIFVRLKNSTNASKVKVHFITTKNSTYTDNQSKEFDILPNSDYQSYFFNLSDNRVFTRNNLVDKEYLKQFKLSFDNSESGSVEIEAFSFEREEAITRYVGHIDSCLANKEAQTVTITGNVNLAYKNKTVTVLQSDAQNYDDRLDYQYSRVLSEVTPDEDGSFTATFDLMRNEQTTHLSSKFMVVCDGKRVDKTTMISNIEDFSIVTERFAIPQTTFNVLDYGAKGDAFTNDTLAIQAAIDAAGNAGGGVVLIPGDNSTQYGRRYMMTHIDMKSNVELRISEGATLWQSPRLEEYHYAVPGNEQYEKPVYGHDLDMHGIMWCHACATVNLPFILSEHVENVRITGGGEIRMMDPGVEVEDAQLFLGDPSTNHGCKNILHLCPLYAFNVTNYDVTNINIHKASGWHCTTSHSENVWYSNIIEYDTCCVTSDGMSFGSVKDGIMERCMSYTSDDGLVVSSSYNDDRRFLFGNPNTLEVNNASCSNIYLAHNFAWGGFGNSYIPWGSGCEDFEKVGIHDIEINDNVFGGQKSVGVWNDDPFYGYSKYGTYNSSEENDYAPMWNLHFHNNTYLNGFQMYLAGRMPITNLLVEDNEEYSTKATSNFEHGNFDKNVRIGPMYEDESDWTVGLSNWSREGDSSVEFGTEKVASELGYSGFIKGNGRLYQGLYENQGYYKVSMKIMPQSGNSYFFVEDRVTHKYLAKEKINNSSNFIDKEFFFNNLDSSLLLIGVIHEGNDEIVYFDNCKIIRLDDAKFFDAYALETFENEDNILVNNPTIENKDGNNVLVLDESLTSLSSLYKTLDLGFNFIAQSNQETIHLGLTKESQQSNYDIDLANLNDGLTHYMGLRISESNIKIYVDYLLLDTIGRTDSFDEFNVSLSSLNKLYIDNLLVTSLNEATFEKELAVISVINESGYEITQIGDAKFVGETYYFNVTTNDDIEVKANGVTLEAKDEVYSFVLGSENTIEVIKKVAPIVDPDEPTPTKPTTKGCKGNVIVTTSLIGFITVVGLIILVISKKKVDKKAIYKTTNLGAILLATVCSLCLGLKSSNVVSTKADSDSGVEAVLVNKTITSGSEYMTFEEDKIINTANQPGVWTELIWGSQNDGTVETTSFDITCHYEAGNNGILTLQLNRWDAAQLYKVVITQTSMRWDRWAWSDEQQQGIPVETLGEVGFGLKDGVKYHVDYIRKSWDKMLFINNTKVFSVCQGELTVGCIGIETWTLGYEIENIVRKDGYDDDLWNMSTLDSYKEQLVSLLNAEINKIAEPIVRTEAGKLISKFIADLNKIFLKSDMDALFQVYKEKISELNVEDVANMSKMKKVYTGLEYIGATDASKYEFTKFETIFVPIANNNESAAAYSDDKFTNNFVASVEFSPQILNYWTTSEFRFNYIDAYNYYSMRMTDHSLEFVKVEGGVDTKVFHTSQESAKFQTYRYTIEGNGTNLKLFVNGELMIEDATSNITNKICFRVYNGGFSINDVTYYSYETLKSCMNFVNNYEYGSNELKDKYIALMHKATCEAKVKSLMFEFKAIADQEND